MGFVPLIEVSRGGLPECQHWGAVAVADRDGRVSAQVGDPYTVTFTRSTIKAFQALPFMQSGGARALGWGQGELALLVIRIARALFALTGGDKDWIKHFMHNPNKVTGGIPAKQMETIQGLIQVVQFVDAIRGKV